MLARLDAAQPVLAALLAEPPPSLAIDGLNASAPLIWLGVPGRICFSVPPSANAAPKALVLYIGSTSATTSYVNVLGPANGALPADAQACVNFTVSRGVPAGPYNIALESAFSSSALALVSFEADKVSLTCTAFAYATTFGTATLAWSLPAARASASDTVRIVNAAGTVINWFYTSCKCQSAPGAAAVAAGSFSIRVFKGSVLGGFTFELHPGGLDRVAAVAPDWIPWAKFGW
jgi:hypothetical protein